MAYYSMAKLIANENKLLETGQVTKEEYELFKQNSMNKLDVFLSANRITASQYKELSEMLR
jgi:hypothetical protein